MSAGDERVSVSSEELEFQQRDSRYGEPIAVIGMACCFPGCNDVEEFWQLLEAGKNAITQGLPGSGVGRIGQIFRDAGVAEACRFLGFIDGIDQFDADFFRISPLEAQFLDPQQRLMLETSWCALEDAGIDPEQLKGSRTGIYSADYRYLIRASSLPDSPAANLYEATGAATNTAAGRISYVLGLERASPCHRYCLFISTDRRAPVGVCAALERSERDQMNPFER